MERSEYSVVKGVRGIRCQVDLMDVRVDHDTRRIRKIEMLLQRDTILREGDVMVRLKMNKKFRSEL